MRELLFLVHRIPYPPDRGDKIRSFNILRHLARQFRVHLACFADDPADAGHLDGLRAALEGQLGETHVEIRPPNRLAAARALLRGGSLSMALFDSARMRAFVADAAARHDVDTIFAFSSQMAQFVPAGWPGRFIMDFVDVDSAKFAEYGARGSGPMAALYRLEARRLHDVEQTIAARADSSLFVSEAEAALFCTRSRHVGAVLALGNGVDLDYFDPQAGFAAVSEDLPTGSPLILFTGQMDYRPNVEAVTSFAREVMPRIRQRRPDSRFAIVGRKPSRSVRRLEGLDGTRVIGAVEDVRSWLAAADVVVAPLKIARGIQNKVLEAMAMARPVVASAAAFEGIDALPGRDLIVADDAADQAEAILGLLADPQAAAALGEAGRRRIEAAYAWDARVAPLDALIGVAARQAAA